MRYKSYKYCNYKAIDTRDATPYLNIYTGQRIFIDRAVVPPKNLFYVEDLNPYARTISVVVAHKDGGRGSRGQARSRADDNDDGDGDGDNADDYVDAVAEEVRAALRGQAGVTGTGRLAAQKEAEASTASMREEEEEAAAEAEEDNCQQEEEELEREKRAANIISLIQACVDKQEESEVKLEGGGFGDPQQQGGTVGGQLGDNVFEYPVWFDQLLDIMTAPTALPPEA